MAYNENLAERITKILQQKQEDFYDIKMFGGICFMVNEKMCVGVMKNQLMARVGPNAYATALNQDGAAEMKFTGRPMKGYILVDEDAVSKPTELNHWINLCLAFNPLAKKSKKRTQK